MGRTRLFHTVVIVGSSLLANCDKGTPAPAPAAKHDDASTTKIDAPPPHVLIDAAPPPVMIMAAPRPEDTPVPVHPRIQARPQNELEHKKLKPKNPPPPRIMVAPRPKGDKDPFLPE